jgi:hypothetical protein
MASTIEELQAHRGVSLRFYVFSISHFVRSPPPYQLSYLKWNWLFCCGMACTRGVPRLGDELQNPTAAGICLRHAAFRVIDRSCRAALKNLGARDPTGERSPGTSFRFTKIHDYDSSVLSKTGSRTAPLAPGARLARFCFGRRAPFVERLAGNGALCVSRPCTWRVPRFGEFALSSRSDRSRNQ